MSANNKKQFGVWMDSQNAIVLGREGLENGDFVILAREKSAGQEGNSNENATNNSEKGNMQKLFRNITTHMQNVDEVHVTGTGTSQEQFIKYMAQTPQYKNTQTEESTSNKMSDEALIEYITAKFR